MATDGALISEARSRAGISQEELARRLELSASMVGRYERDATPVSPEQLARIVAACAASAAERERGSALRTDGHSSTRLVDDPPALGAPEPTAADEVAPPSSCPDPEDPEQFVASLIFRHPSLFPNRTAVLRHVFGRGGSGYGWDADGRIVSVMPDDASSLSESLESSGPGWLSELVEQGTIDRSFLDEENERVAQLEAIRANAAALARTTGDVIVHLSDGPEISEYSLLRNAPANVSEAWRPILEEARAVLEDAYARQAQAVAGVRAELDATWPTSAAGLALDLASSAWVRGEIDDSEWNALRSLLERAASPLDPEKLAARKERWESMARLSRSLLADADAAPVSSKGAKEPRSLIDALDAAIRVQLHVVWSKTGPAPHVFGVDVLWASERTAELLTELSALPVPSGT